MWLFLEPVESGSIALDDILTFEKIYLVGKSNPSIDGFGEAVSGVLRIYPTKALNRRAWLISETSCSFRILQSASCGFFSANEIINKGANFRRL